MMEYSVSKALCSFTFEGEDNEIDAATLVKTLSSLNTLVFESSDALYPDTKCNLKVAATESGSFVVGLMVVAQYAQSLFMPENITYAKNVVEFIKAGLEVKKFIGGNKPKSVVPSEKGVIVQNGNGEVRQFNANTINFFENPVFERSITEMIDTANGNLEIKGISFQDDETSEPFKINRSEFQNMMIPVIESRPNPTTCVRSTETMFVKQATFIGNEKWKFTKDRTISAKITDSEWLEGYRRGKYDVRPGFQLCFDLETSLEMHDGMPIESSAIFEMPKIHHIIRPESFDQTML